MFTPAEFKEILFRYDINNDCQLDMVEFLELVTPAGHRGHECAAWLLIGERTDSVRLGFEILHAPIPRRATQSQVRRVDAQWTTKRETASVHLGFGMLHVPMPRH